jgi:hypothetical protein
MLHFESLAAANNDEAILKSIDVAFMDVVNKISNNYDIPLDTLVERSVEYLVKHHKGFNGKH